MLFVIYFSIFVYLFYACRQPYLDFNIYGTENPFYSYFSQLSVFIYTVNIAIIFGISTSLLEYVLAYFDSTAKFAIKKRKVFIHKRINETLFDHLAAENNLESNKKYIEKINKMFVTDYPKLVFINRLRRIMTLSTTQVSENCILLFKLMQPESLIKTYAKSPYKRHKLFALKIIADFRMELMGKDVIRLMKKEDAEISSEAIFAYIRICPNTNLKFLISRNKQISRLDFYNIIQLTANYRNIDCKSLISSELTTISALGLRLAAIHEEITLKHEIVRRIDHQDDLVRIEAQNAFISLLDEKDLYILIERFEIFNNCYQLRIIKILGEFFNIQIARNFLETIIETKDNNLKLLAMKFVMRNDIMAISKYRNHPDTNIRNVYKQLTDFNL